MSQLDPKYSLPFSSIVFHRYTESPQQSFPYDPHQSSVFQQSTIFEIKSRNYLSSGTLKPYCSEPFGSSGLLIDSTHHYLLSIVPKAWNYNFLKLALIPSSIPSLAIVLGTSAE